jgi:hypothetical protein
MDRLKHYNLDFNNIATEGKGLQEETEGGLNRNMTPLRKQETSIMSNTMSKALSNKEKINKLNSIHFIRNRYFTYNEQNKHFTNLDYDLFDISYKNDYDKRSNMQYFCEYIMNYNLFLWAFFKKSLLIKKSLRICILFQLFFLYGLFNATFFSDEMVEYRVNLLDKVKI